MEYPKVDLVLEEFTTVELINCLNNNWLDIALLRLPIFEPCDVCITVVERHYFIPVAHANSKLAQRDSIALVELGDEVFINYFRTRAPNMHAITRIAFSAAEIDPHISQEAVQVQTIFSLVRSGVGIEFVPSIAARDVGTDIKVLNLTDRSNSLAISIGLATQPDASSPATKNFVEIAIEVARTMRN